MIDFQLSGAIFDLDYKKEQLEQLTRQQEDPKIWDDHSLSQKIGKEKRILEDTIQEFEQLNLGIGNNKELFDLAIEENDDSTLDDLLPDPFQLENKLSQLEFKRMFSNPLDPNNCFIDFQSGSGGTEAQDWANMLLCMYWRYGEAQGFRVERMGSTEGEVGCV